MEEERMLVKGLTEEGWREGYYFRSWDDEYILWGTTNGKPNMVLIKKGTACRRTGVKAKGPQGNIKMLHEGDIVTIGRINPYTKEEKVELDDVIVSIHEITNEVLFKRKKGLWHNTLSEITRFTEGECLFYIKGNIHDGNFK
jgi:hypothetical protein